VTAGESAEQGITSSTGIVCRSLSTSVVCTTGQMVYSRPGKSGREQCHLATLDRHDMIHARRLLECIRDAEVRGGQDQHALSRRSPVFGFMVGTFAQTSALTLLSRTHRCSVASHLYDTVFQCFTEC